MPGKRRSILVTGATGQQGGAVVEHLLQASNAFNIIALTRNPDGERAQKLAKSPNVRVLTGDLDDVDSVFTSAGPVWGVFSVQIKSPAEESQGKALTIAAIQHGVRHIVYTSGDRGGPTRSAQSPTTVKNLMAKHAIEQHLIQSCQQTLQLSYTILRPVVFFENLTGDFSGRAMARMWQQLGDKPLQFVAYRDVGWFAAQSFARPREFDGRAISLAGDELTQEQGDMVFRRVVGFPMPVGMGLAASAVKCLLRETVGSMFQWYQEEGYGADVEACRREYPDMQDFESWLEEHKGWWIR